MRRRNWLKACAVMAAGALAPGRAHAASRESLVRRLGKPEPFDYARLKGRARAMADRPHVPPSSDLPEAVRALDYDRYQTIRHLPEHGLWAGSRLPYDVRFFHLGLFFRTPVHVYEVIDGYAREIAYDAAMFDYGRSGLDALQLPEGLGFAGFKLLSEADPLRDVAAFLGASYFRAVGSEMQYGASARGLAIDTGMARAEEFPSFIAFWLERPRADATSAVVYALLDSPSVAGAYRFEIGTRASLTMHVDAALYPRAEIERLGIAPLTSMFLHAENDRRVANDWRPEIHDSDGLSMWTGAGEWIWRPLENPGALRFNAYQDENPRGFGLLQRDRDFYHYQDDGAYYDRRPSVWVEPRSGWGKGWVQLVELSTPDETFDNIVAFWHPAQRPRPGQELLYSYRLHWGARVPQPGGPARAVATRTGLGGVIGRPRTYYSRRFVVDFAGSALSGLGDEAPVEPVITVSGGQIEVPAARPLHAIEGYRVSFDVRPAEQTAGPIDLRLFLRLDGRALTETWLYQWTPPPPAQRRVG